MNFINSSLVNITQISPYRTERSRPISKITVHHMAGNLSAEACGDVFQTRQASANYGIDSAGRVGLYVEEKDRAWATANPENDHAAVNIEVANDRIGGDWHVSDTALVKLVDLCTDICRRNGIAKLTYTGDRNGNLTTHNMFMATTCPGPYLAAKMPWLAEEVNARLSQGNANPPQTAPQAPQTAPKTEGGYLVRVTAKDGLNIRQSAGTNTPVVGIITDGGVYTIVAEADGQGAQKWGKLKSGMGWIALDFTERLSEKPNIKSNEELAKEVSRGDWGNGQERKNRLAAAGYDYEAVQRLVK